MSRGEEPSLEEVAPGCWAYVQPDGSWGYSNAGLITDHDASLLVDTLYDLRLAARMAAKLRAAVPGFHGPGAVLNTHGNGDHCYGNGAFPGVPIVACEACAREMKEVPPKAMVDALRTARRLASLPWPLSATPIPGGSLGELGRWFLDCFGDFAFEDGDLVPPDTTFVGALDWQVGDRRVELRQVGPAHTAGDVLAWVPDARVVYTGDILFSSGHPIIWDGSVAGWIAACDQILAWGPEVVVPGHGPVCGPAGVQRMRDYLVRLYAEVHARFAAGMSVMEAALDLDLRDWSDWGEAERVVVNVDAIYRDLRGDHARTHPWKLLAMMARLAHRRSR
jgi:cyclase